MINIINHFDCNSDPLRFNEKDATITLKKGVGILSKLDIYYWVSAGTALGMIRDKNFIEHDTDIDVETCDIERTDEIKTAFLDGGFNLYREMYYSYMGDKIISQYAFVDKETSVLFDIYFYKKHPVLYFNINEHGVLTLPAKFVNYRCFRYFDKAGVAVRTLEPVEEYLEWRFGKDWKIKKDKKEAWQKDAPALLDFVFPNITIKGVN